MIQLYFLLIVSCDYDQLWFNIFDKNKQTNKQQKKKKNLHWNEPYSYFKIKRYQRFILSCIVFLV